ncbi:YceD family protein [Xenophilus aerolatus]|nr:DUF177 domain-containing protein [Xenophilus aerolatus]
MKKDVDPGRLDVLAFAQAGATLSAAEPLAAYRRLLAESAVADAVAEVRWTAKGEMRTTTGGPAVPWIHLDAQLDLPLVCQRCLQPVDTPLQADRWFRFVADEETAALEDEEADEDVLVSSHDFDLRELVEDELLMDIPFAPVHEVCPAPVRMSAADPDFEAAGQERPNPFAALEALKKKPSGGG